MPNISQIIFFEFLKIREPYITYLYFRSHFSIISQEYFTQIGIIPFNKDFLSSLKNNFHVKYIKSSISGAKSIKVPRIYM